MDIMEKLKYNVILTIPEDVRDMAQKELNDKHNVDCVIPNKMTIEIYYKEEIIVDYLEWEVYNIKVIETNDTFDISILKIIMDNRREAEKNGDGYIEEFIYEMMMECIKIESNEQEARDFFEEISD